VAAATRNQQLNRANRHLTICSKSAAEFRLTVVPPSLSDTHYLDRAAARLRAGFDELEYAKRITRKQLPVLPVLSGRDQARPPSPWSSAQPL
jgi:hypothetical protein